MLVAGWRDTCLQSLGRRASVSAPPRRLLTPTSHERECDGCPAATEEPATEEYRVVRCRMGRALRIGGALPRLRLSRLDRSDQHAHVCPGAGRARPFSDQPLWRDVR